ERIGVGIGAEEVRVQVEFARVAVVHEQPVTVHEAGSLPHRAAERRAREQRAPHPAPSPGAAGRDHHRLASTLADGLAQGSAASMAPPPSTRWSRYSTAYWPGTTASTGSAKRSSSPRSPERCTCALTGVPR